MEAKSAPGEKANRQPVFDASPNAETAAADVLHSAMPDADTDQLVPSDAVRDSTPALDGEQPDGQRPYVDAVAHIVRRRPVESWTVFVFLVFAVRVLLQAHGSHTTALAIVAAAGPLNVLTGLVLDAVPILLVAAAVCFWLLAELGSVPLISYAMFLLCFLAAYFVTPWPALVAAVVFWALFAFRFRRARARSSHKTFSDAELTRSFVPVVASIAFLATTFVASSGMWLPAERIGQTDGSSMVGYVLSTDNGWASKLREPDRVVVRILTSSITARVLCSIPHEDWPSMHQIIRPDAAPGPLPDCGLAP